LEINWYILDGYIKGLRTLFYKKRKINFGIEFIFKEALGNSLVARGKKKGLSATKAQKL
jgi:hypothetical protein